MQTEVCNVDLSPCSGTTRRDFLRRASGLLVAGGLAAAGLSGCNADGRPTTAASDTGEELFGSMHPVEDHIYFGDSSPYTHAPTPADPSFEEFDRDAGKQASIRNVFKSFGSQTNSEFPTEDIEQNRQEGRFTVVTWEPWNTKNGLNQPDFKLSEIFEGKHDEYIRDWARNAKAYGKPFMLRFAHEMNANWYPWSEQTNGNQSGDYVKAYRYVHDLFKEEGATNATWIWCVNNEYPGSQPVEELYPGDDYVDWIGVDAYNKNNPWRSLRTAAASTIAQLKKLAPNKPLMINETACPGPDAQRAQWIPEAYAFAEEADVRAILWFNFVKNGQDYRIMQGLSKRAMQSVVQKPQYAPAQPAIRAAHGLIVPLAT